MFSREGAKARRRKGVRDAGYRGACSIGGGLWFQNPRDLGAGLLESVYEAILAASLRKNALKVERQKPIAIEYEGLRLAEGFRADLLVEDQLIIEIKSLERLAPVHGKQLLTYLRLSKQPLGLLMNFGGETFREGIKRVVNDHKNFAPSRRRVNQSDLIQATCVDE